MAAPMILFTFWTLETKFRAEEKVSREAEKRSKGAVRSSL
jgi:hypothetical protein